jgi:hypothetical protein
VLAYLHGVHARLASRYAHRAGVGDRVISVLREPMPAITLVHSCTHFSRCYGLNRFVALLVLAIAPRAGRMVYLPDSAIVSVSPSSTRGTVPHACTTAEACHGKDHDVAIARRQCSSRRAPSVPLGAFNIVILRHGLEPRVGDAPTLTLRRHLLPYRRL